MYTSVPVDRAINCLLDTLNNDEEQLKEHTKLKLTDKLPLTEICISKCCFLYENNLHLFQNSKHVGL